MVVSRKYIFFLFILCSATLKAQNYNFDRFGVGFNISSTHAYTNVPSYTNSIAQSYTFTYYYSPFVPLSAEVQLGSLSGGGPKDPFARKFLNKYQAVVFHGDLQLGEIIDYQDDTFLEFAKNFYGGTGFGFIKNNLTVQRTSLIPPTNYVFPGSDHSVNVMVPLRIGYEVKIFNPFGEPFIRLNVGYVHNLVFGEGLDGYDDPSKKFKNNNTNQYRQITVGIKIDFGSGTSYEKAQ